MGACRGTDDPEKDVTPLSILVASIVVLGADYLLERYFGYLKSPKPGGLFSDPTNNWLRNPLRESRIHHV